MAPKANDRRHPLRTRWKCRRIGKYGRGLLVPHYRTFTQRDVDIMREGLDPEQMEDKWVAFLEDDVLCLHRSWTGRPFAEATITRRGKEASMEAFRLANAWLDGENAIVQASDMFDMVTFGILLSRVPTPANIQDTSPAKLAAWAEYGMLRSKAEIDATRGFDTSVTPPEEYEQALRRAGLLKDATQENRVTDPETPDSP